MHVLSWFCDVYRYGFWKMTLGSGSEEAELAEEIDRLDKEHPGWDHQGLVAGASRALELFDREIAVHVYGEDIVKEAELKYQKKKND